MSWNALIRSFFIVIWSRFMLTCFILVKFATLISLSSSMVGGFTSISCTLSLGKPASAISNNCCETSVAKHYWIINYLYQIALHANNTFILLLCVATGLTYLSLHRCADWFFLFFLICFKESSSCLSKIFVSFE